MIDYTIYILEKVSFDPALFLKELKKALTQLQPIEIILLKDWFAVFTKNIENLKDLEVYFMKN